MSLNGSVFTYSVMIMIITVVLIIPSATLTVKKSNRLTDAQTVQIKYMDH